MTDAQSQTYTGVGTRDKTLEDMLNGILRNTVTRILDGNSQLVTDIVITRQDRTGRGVLGCIVDDLFHDHRDFRLIDLNHQLLVGILHDIVHTRLLVVHPSRITSRLEDAGEVDGLLVDGDHAGIQTRQEQDVVDQLQQGCRTLLDLSDKHGLVFCTVFHLEEFRETDH